MALPRGKRDLAFRLSAAIYNPLMTDIEAPKDSAPKDPDPPPAASELLDPRDYSQYLLHSPSDIHFSLRSLLDAGARITVYFNEGKDFLLTTLLRVGDDDLVLDYGGNEEMDRKALVAGKLFCAAQQGHVKIQFILHGFRKITHEGRPAFQADIPDSLLRLQRREFYRLTVPLLRPLRCSVPYAKPDGSMAEMEIKVVDISIGGLQVLSPPEGIGFKQGATFPGCRLELPEVGFVNTTLKVRGIFDATLRSGATVKRAGCEFVNLPGPMMTLVQRYIIKVERERKARESGLG